MVELELAKLAAIATIFSIIIIIATLYYDIVFDMIIGFLKYAVLLLAIISILWFIYTLWFTALKFLFL